MVVDVVVSDNYNNMYAIIIEVIWWHTLVSSGKIIIYHHHHHHHHHYHHQLGAGISTSSGINDYASKSKDSKSKGTVIRSPWEAQPTPAHRV